MNSWKNLAVASILATAVFGLMVACGSDDSDGDGDGGSSASAGSGSGSGTGGSAANGNGGSGSGSFFDASGTGDAAADSLDPDAACATSTVSATLTAANLLFVIDRTGSMNCNAPPTQTTEECETSPVKKDTTLPSKWEITRDALTAAWQGLTSTDPLPSVGVMLFNNDDICGIPDTPDVAVAPLTDPQLNSLVINLNNVTPKGSTPIIGATMRAYYYLHTSGTQFEGNKFVVLLTDGAETCDLGATSKSTLIQKAQDAASVGIRTFVLGAPGSESERAFLSQLAFAGGTASSPTCDYSGSSSDVGDCHMDMTLAGMNFAQELQSNLEAISGEALSCEFVVPDPEVGETLDYGAVNVIYTHGDGTEETIPQDPNLECSDPENEGWQYSDDKETIILCGGACEKVKDDSQASISIQLGCATVIVPK